MKKLIAFATVVVLALGAVVVGINLPLLTADDNATTAATPTNGMGG